MNLLHMNYFIAIAEKQSISRAARDLFITQQTLSAHVAAMEKELGNRLFERSPKFQLTYAGEVFYQYCLRFRGLNDAMVREFQDMSGEISDILRVGISQTRSHILMPKILIQIHNQYPRVQVRVSEQTNDLLLDKLLKGEIDLMIGDVPDNEPQLSFIDLYQEHLVLALPKELNADETLAAAVRTGNLSVLSDIPFVMNTQNDIAGRLGTAILEGSGIVPRIAAMSDSAETCLQLCADGLGAYTCPDIYVHFYSELLKDITTIPLGSPYPIRLAYKKSTYGRASIHAFLQLCQDHMWEVYK